MPEIGAEIALPLSQLKSLPPLPIVHRNQHVTASLKVENDSVRISALCDSIPQLQVQPTKIIPARSDPVPLYRNPLMVPVIILVGIIIYLRPSQ